MPVRIDPNTGERIGDVQIDPNTGERITPAVSGGGILDTVSDFGKGLLKGAVHTMAGADDFATKHLPTFMTTPIGQTPNAENSARATQYAKDLAAPHNTSQSIGRGVEQMGEFLVPGAAEEAVVGKGASLLPRMIASAAGAGVVNRAQGGSFTGGALAGAAGPAIATGISNMAAPLAEKAMGIGAAQRIPGKNIGQEIINRTTGVRPATVARQAGENIANDASQLNGGADSSQVPVDLAVPRGTVQNFLDKADLQSERAGYNEIQGLNEQLHTQPSGAPIPQVVPARQALELKRGVDAYQNSWNPTVKHTLPNSAVSATHAAMQPGLEAAIPDYANLNSRIQTMIPVEKRATATDLNENLLARTLSRFGAKTGALAPLIAGAGLGGGATHSVAGTAIGGALGLIGPEILANPTTLMTGARVAASPVIPQLMRPLTGAALQLNRKRDDQ